MGKILYKATLTKEERENLHVLQLTDVTLKLCERSFSSAVCDKEIPFLGINRHIFE